jgi:uncharacterized delta-60 repeat protein
VEVDTLALEPGGDVLTAGLEPNAAGTSLVLTRLAADGSPDPTFGDGGSTTTAIPAGASITALHVDPDGGVVAAGSSAGQALVERFSADGSPDATFGNAGSASFGPSSSSATAVGIDPDGVLAAAGTASGGLLLARLGQTGALDTSFGSQGLATDPRVQSTSAVLGDSSRTLVAGSAAGDDGSDFAVEAFRADGSPDPSFGEGGLVTTDFSAAPASAGGPRTPAHEPHTRVRAHAAPPKHREAPNPVPAWYVNADNMTELKRFAAADACAFAHTQPRSANRVLILDFGGARAYINGNFGAAVNNASFTASNRQIRVALQVAADAYASCHRQGQAQITYAVTNHFKSTFAANRARQIGVHQARTVNRLWRYERVHGYVPAERAGVAGDIEPGYWGPKYSKRLANGAKATWPRGYMDFGTAGGCPPHPGLGYLGHGCFNDWTLADIAQVSHANDGRPLPEIYYRGNPNHFDQAAQWRSVARTWDSTQSSAYVFAGTTGSTQFSGMTPGESWVRMAKKAPGHVGRELLNFKEDQTLAKGSGGG